MMVPERAGRHISQLALRHTAGDIAHQQQLVSLEWKDSPHLLFPIGADP